MASESLLARRHRSGSARHARGGVGFRTDHGVLGRRSTRRRFSSSGEKFGEATGGELLLTVPLPDPRLQAWLARSWSSCELLCGNTFRTRVRLWTPLVPQCLLIARYIDLCSVVISPSSSSAFGRPAVNRSFMFFSRRLSRPNSSRHRVWGPTVFVCLAEPCFESWLCVRRRPARFCLERFWRSRCGVWTLRSRALERCEAILDLP